MHEQIAPDPQALTPLLATLDDAVLVVDRAWVVTYANPQAVAMSRLRREDLGARTYWELFPDLAGGELERKYRRAMEERASEQHEFFYPPLAMWIAVRVQPAPNGAVIVYRNVTERKQAEEARNRAMRQLEQVLELTTDGVASLDRSYRFTFLNRSARELLVSTGENLIGRSIWDVYPDAVYPGSPFVESYGRSMEGRESAEFEAFYGPPLRKWFRVKSCPSDEGIILFFRDVTAARAQEENMRDRQEEAERQRAEIEAVYRTAPIGLALFDPVEFRYLRLNDRQAEFFGLRRDQVLGRTLTEMAPIDGLRELFEQVVRGEPVRNFPLEGSLATRPEEHRYWTVNYFPVFAPDGSVQAITAASLEITQQKRAEAALIQSEKLAAVGRLATSISHEINNPLESITNLLYLVANDEGLSATTRGYVEAAQSELQRVSQIATQTLRFHRQSAKPARLSAAQLVEPVLDLYQGRLANSGIEVERRFQSTGLAMCFENDIRQVLNNLLANAIDAMRGGGRLLVRSHDACAGKTGRPGVRLTVADTGHGMSESVQRRILEPFYTTKGLNGNGLGLWISSEIMLRHEGALRFRSAQHRGTVFSLFLSLDGPPARPK